MKEAATQRTGEGGRKGHSWQKELLYQRPEDRNELGELRNRKSNVARTQEAIWRADK